MILIKAQHEILKILKQNSKLKYASLQIYKFTRRIFITKFLLY